jgi:hypothetical protein
MKLVHLTAAAGLLTHSMWTAAAFAATVGTATVDDPVAQGLNSTNLAAAQAQCTALAAAHAATHYTGTLDSNSIEATLVSGPTETGTRDKTNINGIGTFTPGHTYIQGEPFRVGGSVNMFGDQYANAGTWSDSQYDFTNQFTSTFSYAFNCNMTETVHVPVQGYYEVADDAPGNSGDAVKANCEAFNAMGPDPSQPWWGSSEDHAFCHFVMTSAAHDEEQDRPDESGTPINQDQTDTLIGHEYHGGPVQAQGGPFHLGQVAICISPSTTTKKGVPGVWKNQNGYTGTNCSTAYFNSAPWGAGTESSNGTYISVPDYVY